MNRPIYQPAVSEAVQLTFISLQINAAYEDAFISHQVTASQPAQGSQHGNGGGLLFSLSSSGALYNDISPLEIDTDNTLTKTQLRDIGHAGSRAFCHHNYSEPGYHTLEAYRTTAANVCVEMEMAATMPSGISFRVKSERG